MITTYALLVSDIVSLVFPDHLDKTVLCNDINRFFLGKIEIIREEIDTNYISP